LLGIYFYIWRIIELYWNEAIHLGALYLILFSLVTPGVTRSYLLDADLLYLIPKPQIIRKERNKLNQFIFMVIAKYDELALDIEYSSRFNSSEPRFLFPKSRRIFKVRTPENVLLEFCLKAFIRNRRYRFLYIRMIGFPYSMVYGAPLFTKLFFKLLYPYGPDTCFIQ